MGGPHGPQKLAVEARGPPLVPGERLVEFGRGFRLDEANAASSAALLNVP